MLLSDAYGKLKEPNQKEVLNYIADLANTTGFDISQWNIQETFFDGEDLIRSHREINKRFFLRTKVLEEKKQVKVLTEEQIAKIKTMEDSVFKSLIRQSEEREIQECENLRERISRVTNSVTQLKSIRDARAQIPKISCIEWVDRVLQTGNFELFDAQNAANTPIIKFTTRPVNVSWKRGDGVEFRIPFGRFIINIYPTTGNILTLPLNDTHNKNIFFNDFSFPFFHHSGAICWGNAHEAVGHLRSQGKWAEVMNLLWSLMTNYFPDGGPYIALESFMTATYSNGVRWNQGSPSGHPAHPAAPQTYTCEYCDSDESQHPSATHEHTCEDCGGTFNDDGMNNHRNEECDECGGEFPCGGLLDHTCPDPEEV